MSAVNIIMLMFAVFINASYVAFFIEFIFKCLLFININILSHLTWMHVSSEFVPSVIAYAIIVCIYVIYWTPLCDYFIVRKYSRIEGGIILQYFKDICALVGKDAGSYRLYVNKGDYNAYAFKKDIVVIGSELFTRSEGEIKGVLAHELGHLHYRDSLFWGLFWNMNAVNAFVLNFFYRLAYVLQVLGRVPIPFLNMALWCAGWIVLLTAKINEFIMNFPVMPGHFSVVERVNTGLTDTPVNLVLAVDYINISVQWRENNIGIKESCFLKHILKQVNAWIRYMQFV